MSRQVTDRREFTAVAQLLVVLANGESVEPIGQSLAQASVEEEELTEETAAALDRARFDYSWRGHFAR